jgi:preprotein translocase subunit SecD
LVSAEPTALVTGATTVAAATRVLITHLVRHRRSWVLCLAFGLAACKARPALSLTYEVDTAAAFDGAKDPTKVVGAARDAIGQRLEQLGLGRRLIGVTTRDSDVVVTLGALEPSELEAVKDIVGRTGRLELRRVDDDVDLFANVRDEDLPAGEGIAIFTERAPTGVATNGGPNFVTTHFARIALRHEARASESLDDCRARFERWASTLSVPADHEIVLEPVAELDPDTHRTSKEGFRTLYVFRQAELTNDSIADAEAHTDPDSPTGVAVSVTMTTSGAARFERLTAANVKRRFAILLDGVVESAPVIQAKIGGGHALISMGASEDEEQQRDDARKLALVLRSGSLPAPVRLASEQRL